MPTTRRDNPAELLRLAIIGLDAQIAELQETRAQLAALIGQPAMDSAMKVEAPRRRRRLSAAARAKISAAAKARWEGVRKAEAQKPEAAAKKAESKGKPAKARPTPAGAKKWKSESSTSAMGAKPRKAAR
jgi:hypothetical protein